MRTTLRTACLLALAASSLAGCTTTLGGEWEEGDDLDPTTTLAEEGEWLDEGPPEDDEYTEADDAPTDAGGPVSSTSEALSGAPRFQLPFPCGQVWAGQTRTNHSPRLSIDFNRANDVGDPVVAAAGGTVTVVQNLGSRSYGRWVELDHGNGYRTRYAHLTTQTVRVGQRVAQGERIGTVGTTGGSSGPHLHYELRRNGVVLRPVFNGATAFFYGTKNYVSQNCGSSSAGGSSGDGSSGGTAVTGRVRTSGAALTVRSGPGTGYRAVGSVANGQPVRITCQKRGQTVSGTYGTSSLWDWIGTGYVSDAYVLTGSDGQVAPTCR